MDSKQLIKQQQNIQAGIQVEANPNPVQADPLAHVDREMFKLHDDRSKSRIRRDDEQTRAFLKQAPNDGNVTYAVRRKAETQSFKNMSSRLSKDSKGWKHFWKRDSDEMIAVKEHVNYLNNLLDSSVEKYYRKENNIESIDSNKMKDDIDLAFDETLKACNHYIDEKKRKHEAKHGPGIRRFNKVIEIRNKCEQEKLKYAALAEALKTRSLTDYDINIVKTLSPRELSSRHLSSVAEVSQWQNEGNSTDVYRIRVKEKKKVQNQGQDQNQTEDVYYYIKENKPLLSADLSGFLAERLEQLKVSKQANKDGDIAVEESRMRKSGMSIQDYDNCIDLLETMQKMIKDADDADKNAVKDRIVQFFSHDFDAMFNELNTHNLAADYIKNEGGDMAKWEEILQDKDDIRYTAAKYIVERMKLSGDGKAPEPIEKKTAMQWITEKLGLSADKDKELIASLTKTNNTDAEKSLENLFRVSLGKEVELFGQMRNRMKGNEREIAAANNTGTFVLGDMMGFTDVVTESETRIVRFQDRNGKIVERFCTVTREAEGEEFVEILKSAESTGKKIEYSPEAVKQLMRLQAFDTVCMQVDRHGRNFKCVTEEKDGKIVIKKIMSYDHDMSFGEETLETAFTNKQTGKKGRAGFLPTLTTKIEKNSPAYHYIRERYFGIKLPSFVNEIKEPKWNSKMAKNQADKLVDFPQFMILPFAGDWEYQEGNRSIQKEENKNGYYGPIYRKPTDKEKIERYQEADEEDYGSYEGFKEFEIDAEEQKKVSEQLFKILDKLKTLVVTDNKNEQKQIEDAIKARHKQRGFENVRVNRYEKMTRVNFTAKQKAEILKAIGELHELRSKYDFRHVRLDDSVILNTNGWLDLWMESFSYAFVNLCKDDEEVKEYIFELDQKVSQAEAREREEAMKALTDKDGNIEVPSLLHYDREAYNNICAIAEGQDGGQLEIRLKELNFDDKKIQGIRTRCRELKTFLQDAEKKAKYFYILAGWKNDPVKGKFFLSGVKGEDGKSDYDKIEDLSELSVDPGNTYLSIDNEKYLYGVEDFKKKTNQNDASQAFYEEKKKRNDPKRWNDMGYGEGGRADDDFEKFLNNPLSSGISA